MDIRLITVDPAHFHAALVHKEMPPNVDRNIHIFAPPGPDLDAHLAHLQRFNARPVKPTRWDWTVHARPDFLSALLNDDPRRCVAVLAGRNRNKIDTMLACVEAGMHVFADKPWIIHHDDFPKLERLLNVAARNNVVIYDMMTERHEITTILQRELMRDPEVFGELIAGDEHRPAVEMKSVHALKKTVAGAPLIRPVSFFDIEQYGEGLADVGTHLVDLSLWMIAPDQTIDLSRDIEIHSAERWPTRIGGEQFRAITGESPAYDPFDYWCNNRVVYSVRGHRVRLDIRWDVELPDGDVHEATIRGTRSELRISHESMPQLDVVPNAGCDRAAFRQALQVCLDTIGRRYHGIVFIKHGDGYRLTVPDHLRVGHEAHFAQVTAEFLRCVERSALMPVWELPNLLAKYWITTRGVDLARAHSSA